MILIKKGTHVAPKGQNEVSKLPVRSRVKPLKNGLRERFCECGGGIMCGATHSQEEIKNAPGIRSM